MRDLDNEIGREGLPGQLGDGGDGSDQGVLVSREIGVFFEAEVGSISEDRLVQNLHQIGPAQDDQDDGVGLSPNPLVIIFGEGDTDVVDLADIGWFHGVFIVGGIWFILRHGG